MYACSSPFRAAFWSGIALLAVLLSSTPALAQTAELRGSVEDSSGSALPGVTVTIVNTATGVARVVVTDDQGSFRVPALQPGPYTVESSLSGFNNDTRTVVLTVGQVADLRVALSIGAIQENVQVVGRGATVEIETTKSDLSAVVNQQQLSLALRRSGGAGGTSVGITGWGIRRDLENPIAAPPPGGGTTPASGTLVSLFRGVGGERVDAQRPLWRDPRAPRLAVGGDVQRMRDHRRNQRNTGGEPTLPTDTLVVDQVETTTSTGVFGRLGWDPAARLRLEGGGRYDRIRFAVDDRFLRENAAGATSGADDSGERTLGAWSGHLGASVAVATAFVPYANLSTAFETPTTTELQTGREALGGFSTELEPQRTRAAELGARGDAGRVQYTAALFDMRVRDALVQNAETGGRAFFANAGRTRTTGAELQARVRMVEALALEAAYTWTRARFEDYRVQQGNTFVTYDGNRMPGVPPRMLRVGLRAGPVRGLSLDVDHTAMSDLYADDANTQRVPGWRRGLLNARAAWSGHVGAFPMEPFVGVLNLLDQPYVAAVTVNGANGRVLEPGTPRAIYAGVEIGWRTGR